MRTTIVINEDLLDEVKTLSGAKSKRDAVEKALGSSSVGEKHAG